MATITPSTAVELVRKNLDELAPDGNASVMYTDENSDNESLTATIERMLPECINEVHLAAPARLLEGDDATPSNTTLKNGVLTFKVGGGDFLRLASFRASDSDIVVTDALPEASAEARKQLNIHIRGTSDRPRLVMLQGDRATPSFAYYTTAVSAVAVLRVVKRQTYSSDATGYACSSALQRNVIDLLTARVMETYGDQRAQQYRNDAFKFDI